MNRLLNTSSMTGSASVPTAWRLGRATMRVMTMWFLAVTAACQPGSMTMVATGSWITAGPSTVSPGSSRSRACTGVLWAASAMCVCSDWSRARGPRGGRVGSAVAPVVWGGVGFRVGVSSAGVGRVVGRYGVHRQRLHRSLYSRLLLRRLEDVFSQQDTHG